MKEENKVTEETTELEEYDPEMDDYDEDEDEDGPNGIGILIGGAVAFGAAAALIGKKVTDKVRLRIDRRKKAKIAEKYGSRVIMWDPEVKSYVCLAKGAIVDVPEKAPPAEEKTEEAPETEPANKPEK